MEKPVVPHSIRQAFVGRIFTVAVESITTPKGSTLDAEIVRHQDGGPSPHDEGSDTSSSSSTATRSDDAWELPAGRSSPTRSEESRGPRMPEEIGLIPEQPIGSARSFRHPATATKK